VAVATARKQHRTGRSLAVGAALAALAAGALTMTDKAMAGPGEVVSTINVSGTSGVISDVNVRTQIEHAFPRDLEILLTAPDGTVVPLSTRSPEARAIVGTDPETTNVFSDTLWDDQANDPVTMHTGYANNTPASPLTPEGALGALVGRSANGAWTLTIRDMDLDIAGVLNGWSLQVRTGVDPAKTFVSQDDATPTAIPDNAAGITRTIDMTGNAGLGTVWDLNLRTNITHSAPGDLVIRLTSPSGTTVAISNRRGFDFPNGFASATWDDNGLENITDFPGGVPEGPLVPESAMAVFRGQPVAGVWTLAVEDAAALDTGTLNSWGLDFQTVASMPATSLSSPSNSTVTAIPDFANDPPPPGPDPVTPNPGTPPPVASAPPSAGGAASGGAPVARPGKLAPRSLSLAVTKRDRTAPYKVSASGKLKLPAGVAACFGKVTVTAKAGRKTAAVKKVALRKKGAACTYKTVFTFKSKPKGLPKSGTLKITARFPGNATLRARSGGAKTVKLG
jgi:subtilisin-like proprotein convertase family protein